MNQTNSTSIEDLLLQSQGQNDQAANTDNTGGELQKKMTQIDINKQERLTKQRADELKLNYISLRGYPIGPDTISIITEEEAKSKKTIVFYISAERVRVGIVDPSSNETADLIEELSKRFTGGVDLYLISEDSFQYALRNYSRVVKHKVITSGLEISQASLARYQAEITDFGTLDNKIKTASITEVFTMVLASGINAGASDVHIEANELDIQVRFRIDGVLFEVATLPKESWAKVINRIKLMAKLKMNVNTIPQDGRITVIMDNDKIDIRVSTLPTVFGESVVLRLLKASATALGFDELGIRGLAHDQLKIEVKRPNGMIITTGPTGSGKTTTLYAILNHLNDPESKIITLEDPVEYKLAGISQSQIDSSRDYTFSKGLRAILRQDPDIVMVGEIRDSETTEIAIQAALTGHLVLSTVHTNSAAGTIPRFIALNAKPFLLAPALNAIMAQRLIRRVCSNCKTEYHPNESEMAKVRKELETIPVASGYKVDMNNLKFYSGAGCEKCQHLGLKGRIGIYEVMVMNADIEKIILSGQVSEYVIQEAAQKNGMITMVQDGILKALDGMTTLDEVFRVSE
jgi:type IV pilus assembly protein PilB